MKNKKLFKIYFKIISLDKFLWLCLVYGYFLDQELDFNLYLHLFECSIKIHNSLANYKEQELSFTQNKTEIRKRNIGKHKIIMYMKNCIGSFTTFIWKTLSSSSVWVGAG